MGRRQQSTSRNTGPISNGKGCLTTSTFTDFLFGNRASQRNQLQLAIDALAPGPQEKSSGASFLEWRVTYTVETRQDVQRDAGSPLRMNTLILDSAPGRMSLQQAAPPLLHDLPRATYWRLSSLCLMYSHILSLGCGFFEHHRSCLSWANSLDSST